MDPGSSGYDARGPRLPRAGGDGPLLPPSRAMSPMAPPRRRGWTRTRDQGTAPPLGSPAQAGMDPPRLVPPAPRVGLPRAGGDGPLPSSWGSSTDEAPPRRRGWTPPRSRSRRSLRGSPAQAGMDPRPSRASAPRPWLPRAGGDGPHAGVAGAPGRPAPPRRRGWTRPKARPLVGCGGSPAQAGMDPSPRAPGCRPRRLPRAGGDGPATPDTARLFGAAPPRRRGWTPVGRRAATPCAGSPAQAGMDPPIIVAGVAVGGLPRAGGDGPW